MKIKDFQNNKWDEFCHEALNGLVAIKGLIRQYEVDMLSADEMKNKVETCCRLMEKNIDRLRKTKKEVGNGSGN